MTDLTRVLRPFADAPTALLTTYRRDGTPVETRVNVVVIGDRAFFRTWDTAGKAKRIRHDPNVALAPAKWWGAPLGPPVQARVRAVDADDDREARRALARKHPLLQGVLVPLTHRVKHQRTIHLELVPLEEATAAPAGGDVTPAVRLSRSG